MFVVRLKPKMIALAWVYALPVTASRFPAAPNKCDPGQVESTAKSGSKIRVTMVASAIQNVSQTEIL